LSVERLVEALAALVLVLAGLGGRAVVSVGRGDVVGRGFVLLGGGFDNNVVAGSWGSVGISNRCTCWYGIG